MTLTPEQIDAINTRTLGHQHFARAIEAEARRDALEEAAKVCEQVAQRWSHHMVAPSAALGCAVAIRKLKEDIQ